MVKIKKKSYKNTIKVKASLNILYSPVISEKKKKAHISPLTIKNSQHSLQNLDL